MDYTKYLGIVISLFLPIFSIIVHKGKIYPIFITIFTLSTTLIGYIILDKGIIWVLYMVSIILFFIGYVIIILSFKKKVNLYELNNSNISFNFIFIFSIVIIIFVFYHFIIGGIPIFSSNLEVKRFDFSSSGLLGIPGRMYLYGLPFLLTYVSIYYQKSKKNKKIKQLLYVIWITFIVSRIFAGFKGGMIEVIVDFIFIKALTDKPLNINKLIFSMKYFISILIAIIFAFLISNMYGTIKILTFNDKIVYLINRMTILQAYPGYFIMSGLFKYKSNLPVFLNDMLYFLNKYFKMKIFNLFPLDLTVSASIYGTPLSNSSFLVPVTIGAFPYLFLDIKYFAVLTMFFIGMLYAYITIYSKFNKKIFKSSSIVFLIFFLNDFITKGGLAYCLINYIAVLLILKIFEIASKMINNLLNGIVLKENKKF